MGARISLVIEYIPGGKGNINYTQTANSLQNQGNNISAPNKLSVAHSGGIKPFILGVSKLGTVEQGGDSNIFWGDPSKGDEQWDNNGRQIGGYYNGFWSLQWSNENGDFTSPVTLQIVGQNIDKFVMRFDNVLNEYATVINVDGNDYENSGGEFIWQGVESNTINIYYSCILV